jgi:multidrug efflux pump subunit AcrB
VNPITLALRKPIAVVVAAIAISLAASFALVRMPIDIFPELNTPVIYVVQSYGGMDPAQMEGYLTNYTEFLFLLITGIHHVESRNIQSIALSKLVFHPGTNMDQALAETVNYINRSRAFMPPGTVPPIVLRYDAGSVPVGYLVFSSKTKDVAQVQDEATFRVRPLLSSLSGVSAPPSFGGEARTILVQLDSERLRAYRLAPDDIVNALINGNQVSPSGNLTVGDKTFMVPINSVAADVKEVGRIPIRMGEAGRLYLRDVAAIHDGADVLTGYALVNGRRSVFLPITKRPDASTLSVVEQVKANLPKMQDALSEDVEVRFEFDQSPYVTRAMSDVLKEGILGAVLTGLMVLVFLRDVRSVIVVVLNIPLALCAAVVALWLTGHSINIMTLGGLALAVGILVDEATVEIENIHAQLVHAESTALAVRRGNAETAVPRMLAMLCILAVFIPSFFMHGPVRGMFVPLSLAVGFAMLASWVLSNTFVPVMSVWLLRHSSANPSPQPPPRNGEGEQDKDPAQPPAAHIPAPPSPLRGGGLGGRGSSWFSFATLGRWYSSLLRQALRRRGLLVAGYLALCGFILVFGGGELGREIFPAVDAGQLQLRLRAPEGTPLGNMEALTRDVLRVIHEEAGPGNIDLTIGLVGTASNNYPINFIYLWTAGPQEALLRISLKHDSGIAVEDLKERLRHRLPASKRTGSPALQDVKLSFEAGDIVTEVMSFGSPTPIEVAVAGPDLAVNKAHAEKIRVQLAKIESLRDLQIVQSLDYPVLQVDVDREKAGLSGVSIRDVSRSLVAATSSSRYVVPNFWRDPVSGIGYQIQVEAPRMRMGSIKELEGMPLGPTKKGQLSLRDVARIREDTMPGEYDRYNMRRFVSLRADIHGEDLGRVADRVDQAIRAAGEPPRGVTVSVQGQSVPMQEMFHGLALGLGLTVVVVFLLLSAYFQSFPLALVVTASVPGALAGSVVALLATGTTLNLQSFMGTIMAVGVALANSILLVSFAERARLTGQSSGDSAASAGRGRLRAILMTSGAMLAGMTPMALALGEGGEQTAPLGRAVIGGLALATFSTLFVLPSVFSLVRDRAGRGGASLDSTDPESRYYHPEGLRTENT